MVFPTDTSFLNNDLNLRQSYRRSDKQLAVKAS